MHQQQTDFITAAVKAIHPHWEGSEKIIEIGSYNVNGSIREFFDVVKCGKYIGVDLIEGPGVDIVCSGETVDLPSGSFDIAVSGECFEHNPKYLETFLNMHRMVAAGGAVIFTCASTGRAEHGTRRTTPSESLGTQNLWPDYYKNLTVNDFSENVDMKKLFTAYAFYYNPVSKDLYFAGTTPPLPANSGK